MIRSALTEIGVFLIPFAVYALFLVATRSGLLATSSWPVVIIGRLLVGSLLLVLVSLILLAQFSGAPPDSTYFPAHVENGRVVPGVER
ncbi:DUF6111 family protein [Bradyrhizobium sp.]|jgi:uncharacterized protein DUF6111|uniref:DUF6111 family protein n=1 Tax=Bradyrhizobium sp. TaxID=376 RepID=UPI002D537174|nr:DUF6111 family protein [Bradyrhizobium sp.]HZR75391.1 DUF6111 family protein [Bradyrhizobium sp.]